MNNPLATLERKRILRARLAREAAEQRGFRWALGLTVLLWVALLGIYFITKPF
jgi:hypothetical protein